MGRRRNGRMHEVRSARGALLVCNLVLLACGDLTESVPTDVCLSGIRWTGGSASDEEMAPGTDCLACHLANDGPPFMAAGTVYATVDNASQIANDCFGLEGVEVEIEGADGQVLTTTTNRAGNFYFDGDPAELPKPYVARFRYTKPDGSFASPQMTTEPSYGGCAHCHDSRVPATPGIDITDPESVRPVDGLFVQ